MQSPFLDRINLDSLAQDYWEFSSCNQKDPVVFFEENPIGLASIDKFEEEWMNSVGAIISPGASGRVLDVGAGDGRLARLLRNRGLEVSCLEPSSYFAGLLKADGFDVIEQKWLDWDSKDDFDTLVFNRSFIVCAADRGKIRLHDSIQRLIQYSPSNGFVVFPPIERIVNPGALESFLFAGGLAKPLYTPAMYAFFELGLFPQIRFLSMEEKKEYRSLHDCLEKDFKCIPHNELLRAFIQKSFFTEGNRLIRPRNMITMILSWSHL